MTAPSPHATRAESGAQELLPCPFCGAIPDMRHVGGHWFALCRNVDCPCMPAGAPLNGKHLTEDEAIAAWNRRAPIPSEPRPSSQESEVMDHEHRRSADNATPPVTAAELFRAPGAVATAETVEAQAKAICRALGWPWGDLAYSDSDTRERCHRAARAVRVTADAEMQRENEWMARLLMYAADDDYWIGNEDDVAFQRKIVARARAALNPAQPAGREQS